MDESCARAGEYIGLTGVMLLTPRPDALLDLVADQSEFHNATRDGVAALLRSNGLVVIEEVHVEGFAPDPLTGLPAPARADLLAKLPNGRLVVIEIKTGSRPGYTRNQRVTYTQLIAGHGFSNDPRIVQLGLEPGAALPPIILEQFYLRSPGSRPEVAHIGLAELMME